MNAPIPITEQDLRLCLLQHIQHAEQHPIKADILGELIEAAIARATANGETHLGTSLMLLQAMRRQPAIQAAALRLIDLAAGADVVVE